MCDEIIAEQNEMNRLFSYDRAFIFSCEDALKTNQQFPYCDLSKFNQLMHLLTINYHPIIIMG